MSSHVALKTQLVIESRQNDLNDKSATDLNWPYHKRLYCVLVCALASWLIVLSPFVIV